MIYDKIVMTGDMLTVWCINTEQGRKQMPAGWKIELTDNKIDPKPGRMYVAMLLKERRYTFPECHAIYYDDWLVPMYDKAVAYINGLGGWQG